MQTRASPKASPRRMDQSTLTEPAPTLSLYDVIALTVGIVLGASIFKTPALVAETAGSSWAVFLAWLLGAGVSFVGALCYAELAAAYPDAGGDYHYLHRAFGERLAFLFAWARLAVIQTGSIALLAFVFGDYASELWHLGEHSPSLYAALAVVGLTGLNMTGVRQGKTVQRWLTITTILGLLLIVVAGFLAPPSSLPSGSPSGTPQSGVGESFGMAMVFVLLTYGGWNEAAYVSSELRNVRRNMSRALIGSIGLIALLYLLVNMAYLRGLGLEGMIGSEAVAADLMRSTLGNWGAQLLSLLVVAAALSSANATIFTGARTSFALGRDFRLFSFLGRWKQAKGTPANALLVQGGIVLFLVGLGAFTRQGFEAMVDYTAPVFWVFFFLTGVALLALRRQEPEADRPYRVPFYPWTPLAFCTAAVYMLWSSLAYTGIGAFVGVAVLLAGIPLLFLRRYRNRDN